MRKVELDPKGQRKYEIISKLVETNGNKKAAAVKLDCSIRTINRLIQVYKSEGKEGFSHKNKGRSPAIRYDDAIKEKIIDLYIREYPDANLTHYCEIVKEDLGVDISVETLRLWLLEEKILSPKSHRITRKRMKKRIEQELKETKGKKKANILKERISELDRKDIHPRRERSKYFGEMIQMDASEIEWVKSVKWTLHLAVDDATSMVVGAYFDEEETLNGYYHVLAQILRKYGIPSLFYTDRRTVFEYRRKNRLMDDEDTFTQFSYACHKLGIEIKTTSVPQAKGRIERLNQTFQSRLPIELRRADVSTIEEANGFLESYLEEFNALFALQLNTTKSVFEKQPSSRLINDTLAVLTVRTIDHGHTIHFKNGIYVPAHKSGNLIYLQEGMKVIMVETFDNRLMINVFDRLFYARKIESHEEYSKEFDMKESEKIKPFSWKLPSKRNWRTDDFLGFLARQKHRRDN